MNGARRLWRWTAVLTVWLAGGQALASTAAEVEAAYLAKFAPFVAWPPTAFAGPRAPLVLCVQGEDPFGSELDRMTAGQAVRGHPMIVRRLARLTADSGCQIAYVGGSSAQPRASALRAVDGRPVLTVTDADDEGGNAIVRLVRIDGRVRFMIDARKAGQSGLTISSKLLALAAEVRR